MSQSRLLYLPLVSNFISCFQNRISLHSVACPSSLSFVTGVVNIQTTSVPTVGSTLTFTCSDTNHVVTSTCGSDKRWNPDPEDFMCPTMGKLADGACDIRTLA